MNKTHSYLQTLLLLLLFSFSMSCHRCGYAQQIVVHDSIGASNNSTTIDTVPWFLKRSDWLRKFDIDGDGKTDVVHFDYSGGAHCCYQISITLSSNSTETKYPFEMDGGYIAGVDSTQPEQFNISDIDKDGRAEIFMKIQTYNWELYPLPRKWKRLFGIKSNYIIIEFENGKLITRDFEQKTN